MIVAPAVPVGTCLAVGSNGATRQVVGTGKGTEVPVPNLAVDQLSNEMAHGLAKTRIARQTVSLHGCDGALAREFSGPGREVVHRLCRPPSRNIRSIAALASGATSSQWSWLAGMRWPMKSRKSK